MNNINEEKCYKIYVHINKVNGKKYIGQTKQQLEQRFRDGEGYKNSPKFYGAIKKYGWDNFEHILLFDGLTLEEANKKEEELIKEYDTTNDSNGYNIAYGGDNHVQSEEAIYKMKMAKNRNKDSYDFYKEVFQYDKDGIYIDSFVNAKIAGKELNIEPSSIYACCNKTRNLAGDYIWKFHDDKSDVQKYTNSSYKRIKQIDRHTLKVIREYDSIAIASRETGVRSSSISSCCKKRLKTAGDYIWRYAGDKSEIDLNYINFRHNK